MMDDRTAAGRAQRGDRAAFTQLYEDHGPGCWRLALVVSREPRVARAGVVQGFARVLGSVDRRGADPSTPVAAQLLHATRESAIEGSIAGTPLLANLGDAQPARAVHPFDRLPERLRSVLWLRDVEGLDLVTTGAVLGMTPESTLQLAHRGLTGLSEQFDRTVDGLNPRVRQLMPALPTAVAATALRAWQIQVDAGAGPLGLRLPGGRPVPPWIERGLAGSTAALVGLGVSSAVLLGARGIDVTTRPLPSAGALPSDGEYALRGQALAREEDAAPEEAAAPAPPPRDAPTPAPPSTFARLGGGAPPTSFAAPPGPTAPASEPKARTPVPDDVPPPDPTPPPTDEPPIEPPPPTDPTLPLPPPIDPTLPLPAPTLPPPPPDPGPSTPPPTDPPLEPVIDGVTSLLGG